jgi:hypothetical protein
MTKQDLFWRSRIIPNLLAVAIIVVVVLLAYWNASAEAATALDGRCGMHIGRLIRRDQAGSQYRYRTGRKPAEAHRRAAARCASRYAAGAKRSRSRGRVQPGRVERAQHHPHRGGDLDRVRL